MTEQEKNDRDWDRHEWSDEETGDRADSDPSSGPQHPGSTATGSSRIAMIVDQEPLVRDLLRSVLERLGWRVIGAANADEAASTLDGQRPALLVIDPTPAEALDDDLLARIRTRDPEALIVVVSDDPTAEDIARELGATFMPKPFAIRDFARVVASTEVGMPPRRWDDLADEHARDPRRTADGVSVPAALTAWRAAEGRLAAAPPGSREYQQLASDVERCRAEYRRAFERRALNGCRSWP